MKPCEIVGFEHLHLHTDFSLLDGFGMVEEFAQRATQINQRFLTVSDHGMLGAVPRQIRACERINDKKGKDTLSHIFAAELYVNPLQPESSCLEDMQKFIADLNEQEKKDIKSSAHLLAIAYNDVGYKNLVRLTSWGWTKGFYRKPRVNYEQLLKHKEGLFFTSCCYNSEVGRAFDQHGEDAANEVIERYIKMFGRSHYFLEIMLLDFKKQKPYDAFIIKAHQKYKLPLILTNDCLVPGTLVLTNKGNKKIEELKVGDFVLTHNNRFKKVEYLNVRCVQQAEGVYSVKAAMGTLAWKLTGNHQVRVASIKSKNNKKTLDKLGWKRADELTKDDYLVVPKIKPEFVFSSKSLAYIDLTKILDHNDYRTDGGKVGTGAARKLVLKNNHFLSYHRFDKKNSIKIPACLKVTEDFLRIIGLYMAEGGLDEHSQISFGLHTLEKDEEMLLHRYFNKFGIKLTKSSRGNGKKIFFSSVVFHKLFETLCGKGSSNKQLPKIDGAFFGKFSRKQVLTIVKQYLLGDGHCPAHKDRAAMVLSTSKCLIYDLSCVFNALGIFTVPCYRSYEKAKHKNKNANLKNWRDGYYISFSGRSRIKFSNIFGFNFTKVASDSKRGKRYIELDNSYLVKVSSVKKIKYTGNVFNIQVQEDESYTADLFQVHNCHYCNQEDSKFQRLMLMVQTNRTVQDIQRAMKEDSMQDFFELQDANLWMKSEEELNKKWQEEYSDTIPYELFQQAKKNTVTICEKAKGVQLDRSLKLPILPDADEVLKEEIMKGFSSKNLPRTKEYLNRLKEEYSLITRKGFSSYFLIQKKMTDEARKVCKSLLGWGDGSQAVGPGRGSGAGALTCYCLGITSVDPVKEGLLFSRFMSEARGGRSICLEFKNIDPLPLNEVFDGE